MATATQAGPTPAATPGGTNGSNGGGAHREGALARYLRTLGGVAPSTQAAAYYASLDSVGSVAPSVAGAIVAELRDQRSNLKLIASENFSSLATQPA